LAPRRTTALQLERIINQVGVYLGVKTYAVVTGDRVQEDISKFESGVQVVLGTPGRVLNMIKRRAFDPKQIRTIIPDKNHNNCQTL